MKQCLMLAAGLSSRMGDWKMMLPWGNATVLDSALNNALSFCDRVILVTGWRAETLRQRYAGRADIVLCHNVNYAHGMFASLRCGARLLAPGAFFVVPGDMPVLPPEVYATLWQHRGQETCLVPEYDHGCGHPVLLPADMRSTILAADHTENLKNLILARGRQRIPVASAAIHWDLDTPERYREVRQLTENK